MTTTTTTTTTTVDVNVNVTKSAEEYADFHHGSTDPAIDALSLSGTTAPSSPTDAMPQTFTPSTTDIETTKTGQQGKLRDDTAPAKPPMADLPFRRHNRGIGSIDSILSSTTCVNTQSECSRADSRLSLCHHEQHDVGESPATSQHPPQERPQPVSPSTPRAGPGPGTSAAFESYEGDDQYTDEARLVDEISTLVLRDTWGKDVDDCAAPLLVLDCTQRYLQELELAVHEGTLGNVYTQASSFSHGNSPQGFGDGNQPGSSYNEKSSGKRKAEGSDEGGNGFGGRDDGGGNREEGERSAAANGYSGKNAASSNLSCPYRKRNPLRFNVRDHYVCATHSFSDISQLKKHIRAHHPPVRRSAGLFSCPRCCQGFSVKHDLDHHLRQQVEVMCRIADDQGNSNPEDGITQKIITSLEARSIRAKIDNWNSLWKLLFPDDRSIPDPGFIPVMEIHDFVDESKGVLDKLKDLLELQYRYILEDSSQPLDMDLKIRQGLDRSTSSIYNWIETIVQEWEQRICGISGAAVSFLASAIVDRRPSAVESWADSPQLLPPSPALTPTVHGDMISANLVPGSDNTDMMVAPTPASSESGAFRRRYNVPHKRVRKSELPVKTQPVSQIPVPAERARTPSLRPSNSSSLLRPRPVLPSQPAPITMTSAPAHDSIPSTYQSNWETLTVPSSYGGMPYITSPNPIFQHPSPPMQYPRVAPNQVLSSYFPPSEVSPTELDGSMHDSTDLRHSSIRTSRQLLSSSTPRTSLTWMRDENRDSSQTLVEAHPPGRCQNMYCPSCNKTMPDDHRASTQTVHHVQPKGLMFAESGAAQFTNEHGTMGPFVDQQVEWGFSEHHGRVDGSANTLYDGGQQEGY
ncbi:hypothetical protein B0T22DRAFT_378818 [Podospora appendiculata]|uniref:C2H2-type domain-containing protein n=1 Tax=Podospora appendiculata TaxID=314037 RepID=A0AAE0X821_9PEZI|nr:hypothetical protein B0T22DRAFT_378818 [Podospora appendiculata]